jgi:predicted nucleic acid-binding protein
VVDASVIVHWLVEKPVSAALVARLAEAGEWHVPHLLDLEVLSVLRRLVGAGALSEDAAAQARDTLRQAPFERYPHTLLQDRIWAKRHVLTVYDAAYVALAEVLDLPLLTADVRLAGAPGQTATIETFAPRR